MARRSCVGCRRRNDKWELLRYLADGRGRLALDVAQQGAGRGAYLCARRSCIELACQKNLLGRALRRRVVGLSAEQMHEAAIASLGAEIQRLVTAGIGDGRVHRGGTGDTALEKLMGQRLVLRESRLEKRLETAVALLGRLQQDEVRGNDVRKARIDRQQERSRDDG